MQIPAHTYLVTGAAGFIGSHLSRAILNKYSGSTVVGVDNINSYYDPKIKIRRISELSRNKRFVFYKASILNAQQIHRIVAKHAPTILIHAAAQVGVRNGETHPALYFVTNVGGTIAMLEETAKYIQQAVVFSSSSVYGRAKRLPLCESEPVTISSPLSAYGASKAAMEIAVHNFYKRTNIPVSIIRPFSIYGPDGRPDMLPIKLLMAAMKNTPLEIYAPDRQYRDWTYIDDCVRWILDIVKCPNGFRIINIGSGRSLLLNTVLDMAKTILRPCGYSLSYTIKSANKSEMLKTHADTGKLRLITRSVATTSFKKGFAKTLEFCLSHKRLY